MISIYNNTQYDDKFDQILDNLGYISMDYNSTLKYFEKLMIKSSL